MTLIDVENAQRVEAAAWAEVNGLRFVFDNGIAVDPHAQSTIVWLFRPQGQDRLTGSTVEHRGNVEASIYVPAGTGAVEVIQLAESLQSLFMGRVYAGAPTLDESFITFRGREGSSYRVDVTIPWEYHELRIPQGSVSLYETPGAAIAYQAYRQRWEQFVRGPLSLATYFDNSPPANASVPFAWNRFRTLQPVPVEIETLRVPGRILSSLNFPLESGVAAAEEAIETIVTRFDECSHRGIKFGTPLVNRIGRTPINTWQAIVRLPFHYEVHT